MKVLLTAVSLAAMAATPALAQTTYRTHAMAPDYYAAAPDAGYGAYDYAAPQGYQGYVVGSSPVVTFEGKVVGQDPDINVRQQLERDPGGVAQ